jgi:Protein of unknown function (DUF3197)
MNSSEVVLDPIGMRGSPIETLNALREATRRADFDLSMIIYLTDWEDRRETARVAVLMRFPLETLITEDAFGLRYGEAGKKALADLTTYFVDHGATNFKESVIAPHEFTRLLEYPSSQNLARVFANADPTDPEIYR